MPSSIIGSVLGGVASSVVGGIFSNKASKAQSAAAQNATDAQLQMYNQTREDLAPYRGSGEAANDALSRLMGLDNFDRTAIGDKLRAEHPDLYGPATTAPSAPTTNPQNRYPGVYQLRFDGPRSEFGSSPSGSATALNPSSTSSQSTALNAAIDAVIAKERGDPSFGSLAKKFTLADYTADPGYQFRLDQGNKAINAAQAARGNFYSGAALKEADKYNSGMASQEYGNAYNRFNTDQGNLYSRLGGIADAGRGATNSAISANQHNADSLGNIYGQLGNAQAAGALNQGTNLSNAFSGLFNSLGGSQFGGGGPFNTQPAAPIIRMY